MTLPGSFRPPLSDIETIGPVEASEQLTATVVLRRRAPLPAHARLTRAELAAGYGADPADVEAVTAALRARGVEVRDVDAASRRIRIGGAAGVLSDVFGTSLSRVRRPDGTEHRYRHGSLSLPAPNLDAVVAVLGLDDRPAARANLRRAAPDAATVATSYTPPQLARIYAMPAGTDGTGQTIAIIELGGGYVTADLDHYFGGLGLATPSLQAVGVDGAANAPAGDPNSADGEVVLDIEVAGSIAPKSSLAVYFAPNTDAGFLDAIATAAHADPTPTAISISWGQSEDTWTAQARSAMDSACADAAALGVTVTVASGDNGSSDSAAGSSVDSAPVGAVDSPLVGSVDRPAVASRDGSSAASSGAHCDFPASSPHVLACGGTSLVANASTGAISSETVWNDGASGGASGGGVSDAFALPSWQASVGVPARSGGTSSGGTSSGRTSSGSAAGTAGAAGTGRGVPDVAAVADPSTGYQVYVDGQAQVFGGTSAVAPLWAALVARLAQALGRPLGLPQPALYAGAQSGQAAPGFHDITSGDNGAYSAGPGWDPCTGLGTPNGTALLDILRGADS